MYLDLGFLPASGFKITCSNTFGHVLPEFAGLHIVLLLQIFNRYFFLWPSDVMEWYT